MSVHATHRIPGLVLTDHAFEVPLDHADPAGPALSVFAREVSTPDARPGLPWLVFLQGGPGGKSPRPLRRESWLTRACRSYRVLLLDQRGTGRSTPATTQTLASMGSPAAKADYLAHFRADAIVADAELIRRELAGPEVAWTSLGQSFGGFATFSYLSQAPQGLAGCLVTGGIPSLTASAEEVYRHTYPLAARASARYYRRYPGDEKLVRDVLDYVEQTPTTLPTGAKVRPETIQSLGRHFGMSIGLERVHYLFDEAFVQAGGRLVLSETFRYGLVEQTSFATEPLYVLLQEACYGRPGEPTGWAAQRVRAEFPDFDQHRDGPVLFTGEMMYPWTLGDDPALAPLAEVADLLAERTDWPALYDRERLARNEVPVAAVVYGDDLYVPRELSLQTAEQVPGVRVWLTNEFDHDGVRVSEGRVIGRLLDLLRGEA